MSYSIGTRSRGINSIAFATMAVPPFPEAKFPQAENPRVNHQEPQIVRLIYGRLQEKQALLVNRDQVDAHTSPGLWLLRKRAGQPPALTGNGP